jgi:hypothetical protein
MRAWILLGAILLAMPLSAQTFDCRQGGDYDGRSGRGGRFDLRVRVNGRAVFAIERRSVRVLSFDGMRPRDAGCEYSVEVPNLMLEGLRLEQRDGRSPMRILEEPSRRNGFAIIVEVDDRRRGDDGRHHARITWEDRGGVRSGQGSGSWNSNNGNNNNWGIWGQNQNDPNYDYGDFNNGRVPNWMVGRFEGVNPQTRERFELRIDADGRVEGYSSQGQFRGRARGTEIRVGANRFLVYSTQRGFRTEEQGNPNNRAVYLRMN